MCGNADLSESSIILSTQLYLLSYYHLPRKHLHPRPITLPADSSFEHTTERLIKGPAMQASYFANAPNARMKNCSFNITQNSTTVNSASALHELYRGVSRNAISNTGGRDEDAKCYPGTREEVIGLIEHWMDAPDPLMRILWLSGPAGAGKTAIVKTVAERCRDHGANFANFFFFRGDSTRNHALPLVATLVYQILQLYPAAHDVVAQILSTDPLILGASVQEQLERLISPLFGVILDPQSEQRRIVLHVDGLDECDGKSEYIYPNPDQTRIVHAFDYLVTQKDSPFLVLIASRPEAHIQMALNQLSSGVQSIFLDEKYSPETDIRLFVLAEFHKIKMSHPSAGSLPNDWPSLSDIEDIVAKSSGQFIYAATVMRYIGHAATVPSLSLERVKGLIPPENNSPYTHLDSIYKFILSHANLEATLILLSMQLLQKDTVGFVSLRELLQEYDSRYTQTMIESCVAELSGLVRLTEDGNLKIYHASMADFLLDQSRSGKYWIDVDAFREKVLLAIWEKPPSTHSRALQLVLFGDLRKPTADVTHMLLHRPFPEWTMDTKHNHLEAEPFSNHFLNAIQKLYYNRDVKLYKRIVRRFIWAALCRNKLAPDIVGFAHAKYYFRFYSWVFKIWNTVSLKKGDDGDKM